ncbi:LysM peptidoglycan-binding domain-containing protein [Enterococcus sp. 5H]|uniref:LysM peptidoglycan-binding domain-containing protein n=1 Tax=Enterococcus sp. 5H TaxID=1229490 RepID=UPI002302BC42|nr:LysM peptidoglycan-binding domain-containing protein [Enterococcus sp. 5H]MDA9471146.1 hypothetical protein [Enterococcus sp. 5H]
MKKMLLGISALSTLVVLFVGGAATAHADEWRANNPESINITSDQSSYTMVSGDTLWAISQRINLTVSTIAEINNINLLSGEQYQLPVGRIIYFRGEKVTVAEADGSIINETTITDANKVDPSKNVGEPIVRNEAAGTPNTPVNSTNPVTEAPATPTDSNQYSWVAEQVIPDEGHWEYETVWVPNIVTIVDEPERTASEWSHVIISFSDGTTFTINSRPGSPDFLSDPGVQAYMEYEQYLLDNGIPYTITGQEYMGDVTYPAVTHTEDQGSYEEIKTWIVDKPEQVIPGYWVLKP